MVYSPARARQRYVLSLFIYFFLSFFLLCSTCGAAFISKTQLNLHLKQHHGVQSSKSKTKVRFHLHPSLPSPYLLRSLPPLCPPSKTQLNLHLKQHHGVQSSKKKVPSLSLPLSLSTASITTFPPILSLFPLQPPSLPPLPQKLN